METSEIQEQRTLLRIFMRKQSEHYQRAVDEGIITAFQRTRLLALYNRELNNEVSDEAKEIYVR